MSEPDTRLESVEQESHTCPVCGTKFFATAGREFCPVCILRGATSGESATTGESGSVSGSPSSPEGTEGTSQVRRFEHYEVMFDEAGRPIELGRGAMGVTYKALDVDLRCPVTLKVISKRYLGDESARLRFLREARAAAKVRHTNVASVLHLGRTGSSYFYAMEFVEGETLEHLIRRSGRVEVKLALEIATQVAAGLAAVHEQNLVHRDIKPSNITVSLQEEGAARTWNPLGSGPSSCRSSESGHHFEVAPEIIVSCRRLKNTLNRAASHSYPLSNRSDSVIEHQTLQGLRTTVNLSPTDTAPLGLPMFLVFGSSGPERQKLGVLAKAR